MKKIILVKPEEGKNTCSHDQTETCTNTHTLTHSYTSIPAWGPKITIKIKESKPLVLDSCQYYLSKLTNNKTKDNKMNIKTGPIHLVQERHISPHQE